MNYEEFEIRKPSGRMVYAFIGTNRFHFKTAQLAGPRPILFSAYYIQRHKEVIPWMKKWREWMGQEYIMLVDSGVFTFRSKILSKLENTGRVLNRLSPAEMTDFMKNFEDLNIYKFCEEYIEFLLKTDGMGLWDYCIELDMDEMLGVDVADDLYRMISGAVGKNRVIRVWHSASRDWANWERWCDDSEIEYLAVEGADQHRRNVHFYQKMVDRAAGKKVHLLATTMERFQRRVNSFSVDSSSFLQGGRQATISVPKLANVSFADKIKDDHYTRLSKEDLEYVKWYVGYLGFDWEDVVNDWPTRSAVNLKFSDCFIDVPYIPDKITQEVFF